MDRTRILEIDTSRKFIVLVVVFIIISSIFVYEQVKQQNEIADLRIEVRKLSSNVNQQQGLLNIITGVDELK